MKALQCLCFQSAPSRAHFCSSVPQRGKDSLRLCQCSLFCFAAAPLSGFYCPLLTKCLQIYLDEAFSPFRQEFPCALSNQKPGLPLCRFSAIKKLCLMWRLSQCLMKKALLQNLQLLSCRKLKLRRFLPFYN